jgi:hypothetical protein
MTCSGTSRCAIAAPAQKRSARACSYHPSRADQSQTQFVDLPTVGRESHTAAQSPRFDTAAIGGRIRLQEVLHQRCGTGAHQHFLGKPRGTHGGTPLLARRFIQPGPSHRAPQFHRPRPNRRALNDGSSTARLSGDVLLRGFVPWNHRAGRGLGRQTDGPVAPDPSPAAAFHRQSD